MKSHGKSLQSLGGTQNSSLSAQIPSQNLQSPVFSGLHGDFFELTSQHSHLAHQAPCSCSLRKSSSASGPLHLPFPSTGMHTPAVPLPPAYPPSSLLHLALLDPSQSLSTPSILSKTHLLSWHCAPILCSVCVSSTYCNHFEM